MAQQGEFVTAQEAADILGISRPRVYALIRDGRIKAQKFGPMLQVERASLEAARDRVPGYPKGRPRKKP